MWSHQSDLKTSIFDKTGADPMKLDGEVCKPVRNLFDREGACNAQSV
jgi:hypothetical protein